MNNIKDSGDRTTFATGAVRDMKGEDKGRCDLMPLTQVAELLCDEVLKEISVFELGRKLGVGEKSHLLSALKGFADKAYKGETETMLLEVSKHYKNGCEKYGIDNWKKGIPAWSYIDSAVRHYLKWRRGDADEPHDKAFVWNILCLLWTIDNAPAMLKEERNGANKGDEMAQTAYEVVYGE